MMIPRYQGVVLRKVADHTGVWGFISGSTSERALMIKGILKPSLHALAGLAQFAVYGRGECLFGSPACVAVSAWCAKTVKAQYRLPDRGPVFRIALMSLA